MKVYYPQFKKSYKSTLMKFEKDKNTEYLQYIKIFLIENDTSNIQNLLTHLYNYEFSIKNFYKLFNDIPKEISFLTQNNKDFEKGISQKRTPLEINQHILGYFILQIKAYYVVSIWKIEKLLSSLIRCTNINEIYSALVLSRSILESSVNLIRFCSELGRLKHLSNKDAYNMKENIILLDNFVEDIIFRYLFSSKHPVLVGMNKNLFDKKKIDKISFMEPINILTNIKWIDKKIKKANVQVFEFMQIYNYLSDMVHSNYTSNLNFFSNEGLKDEITYKYDNKNHEIDVFFILTSVCMSLGHLESNALIFDETISKLDKTLEF